MEPIKTAKQRLWESYGSMLSIFEFLDVNEVTQFQQVCRTMYNRRMGQLQTKFKFHFKNIHYFVNKGTYAPSILFACDMRTRSVHQIKDSQFDLRNCSLLQVQGELYHLDNHHSKAFLKYTFSRDCKRLLSVQRLGRAPITSNVSTLLNVDYLAIFAIGCNKFNHFVSTCARFDLQTLTWSKAPEPNEVSAGRSSCALDGIIYLFQDKQTSDQPDRIEWLNTRHKGFDLKTSRWQTISLACNKQNIQQSWTNLVVVPILNSDEILVLGRTRYGDGLDEIEAATFQVGRQAYKAQTTKIRFTTLHDRAQINFNDDDE